MLYMIVENFGENAVEVYRRFHNKGRLAPEGLEYLSSWIDKDMKKCFQLMETDNENLLKMWINNWKDIIDFEIFPVMTSAEAVERIKPKL
jgi:Protein of unknown function (DUF3303)